MPMIAKSASRHNEPMFRIYLRIAIMKPEISSETLVDMIEELKDVMVTVLKKHQLLLTQSGEAVTVDWLKCGYSQKYGISFRNKLPATEAMQGVRKFMEEAKIAAEMYACTHLELNASELRFGYTLLQVIDCDDYL